ncbi:MAG TPA: hypothetical protein DDX51_04065 [Clostridiales bacterium]|nr:hypothetical protein [Clostridiales bacterium]
MPNSIHATLRKSKKQKENKLQTLKNRGKGRTHKQGNRYSKKRKITKNTRTGGTAQTEKSGLFPDFTEIMSAHSKIYKKICV